MRPWTRAATCCAGTPSPKPPPPSWTCRRARAARLWRAVKVARAAVGPVKLEGRAVADRPSPAGVSGTPSAWWDVGVDAWSDSGEDGGWKQVMAEHGGDADVLLFEDETGRMPVWLRDADLLLQEHTWESGKQ